MASILLVPVMFTLKNDFFRRRLVILIDGTFDIVFGAALPFWSMLHDAQSSFGVDDMSLPWSIEWAANTKHIAMYTRFYSFSRALFILITATTFFLWHLDYNQVFEGLREDITMVRKAKHAVANGTPYELHTKRENPPRAERHRSSIQIRHAVKLLVRYQLHMIIICIIYGIGFLSVVTTSRVLNSCPSECTAPIFELFLTYPSCNCYIWKADCTELKLETNETMYQYFERIPSKTMFLSLYNCPLLNDIGAPFVRLDLTYLHVENTQVSKLTWKPTELLTGVAIINAPLDHVPKVLYERVRTTKLELSGTRLRTIPAQAMKFIRSLKLRNNPLLERKDLSLLNLRSLDLSGSPITSNLAEMYFKVKLNVLIMDNCGLETIGSAFNTRHVQLRRLSFADNSITEIDPGLLSRFHNTNYLNLSGNPICQVGSSAAAGFCD